MMAMEDNCGGALIIRPARGIMALLRMNHLPERSIL